MRGSTFVLPTVRKRQQKIIDGTPPSGKLRFHSNRCCFPLYEHHLFSLSSTSHVAQWISMIVNINWSDFFRLITRGFHHPVHRFTKQPALALDPLLYLFTLLEILFLISIIHDARRELVKYVCRKCNVNKL